MTPGPLNNSPWQLPPTYFVPWRALLGLYPPSLPHPRSCHLNCPSPKSSIHLIHDRHHVDDKSHGQGAGAALMQRLAQIATDHHCTHMVWTADARHTCGLQFHHRLGAEIIKREGLRCYWQWTPV